MNILRVQPRFSLFISMFFFHNALNLIPGIPCGTQNCGRLINMVHEWGLASTTGYRMRSRRAQESWVPSWLYEQTENCCRSIPHRVWCCLDLFGLSCMCLWTEFWHPIWSTTELTSSRVWSWLYGWTFSPTSSPHVFQTSNHWFYGFTTCEGHMRGLHDNKARSTWYEVVVTIFNLTCLDHHVSIQSTN